MRRARIGLLIAAAIGVSAGCDRSEDATSQPPVPDGSVKTRLVVRAADSLRPGERHLPDGFLPLEGSAIHSSGGPQAILCTKDQSVMLFVPGGEFVSGLSDGHVAKLAVWEQQGRIPAGNDPPDLLRKIRNDLRDRIQPETAVHIGPFYVDKHEVTNRQYRLFIAEQKDDAHRPGIRYNTDGYNIVPQGRWKFYALWKDSKRNHDDQPVTCVSAEDVLAYARWAGKTIPTRLQWERAAVGEGGRVFPWGSDFKVGYCRCSCMPVGKTVEDLSLRELWHWPSDVPSRVGTHPHDVSPFGCYDMAGNVSEWVSEEAESQTREPRLLVVGGNAGSFEHHQLVPAQKYAIVEPGKRVGFRTVLLIDDTTE